VKYNFSVAGFRDLNPTYSDILERNSEETLFSQQDWEELAQRIL
jgi:hypothetical protein